MFFMEVMECFRLSIKLLVLSPRPLKHFIDLLLVVSNYLKLPMHRRQIILWKPICHVAHCKKRLAPVTQCRRVVELIKIRWHRTILTTESFVDLFIEIFLFCPPTFATPFSSRILGLLYQPQKVRPPALEIWIRVLAGVLVFLLACSHRVV